MSRIAYVNGRYVPLQAAAIRIEDRGYQFADGVYEVMKLVDRKLLDFARHFARLARSLGELQIKMPMSERALALVLRETCGRNGLTSALVYLQVNRGVAPRNHVFSSELKPTVVVTVRPARFPTAREVEHGVKVITLADERWAQCHIKSISLLPNVLAKQRAAEAGAREAWLIDADGLITEGSSSNAYIVDREGQLVTRPLGPAILGGVTRSVVLEIAREAGIPVVEQAFSRDDALVAREAFLTSTSSLVLAVTEIDGRPVANGRPGSITARLAARYSEVCGLPVAS